MVDNNNNSGAVENTEPKTYTQEEVDALLQAEGDRRVTAALKKAEAKNAEKLKEAQRLAQMNEQEKYEYELKQRELAIAEKEKELAILQNKNEASKVLAEKGISLDLVDFVISEKAEDMKSKIDLLDKAFKTSVKNEVEKRLAGGAPQKSAGERNLTKNEFNKLTLQERQRLATEEPDVYNSIINNI